MIDLEFLAFLRSRDASAAERYLADPTSATRRYRNPWSVQVWWLRQEYDNTDRHRQRLREDVEYKERKLDSFQRALEVAKSRPVSLVPTGPFKDSEAQCKEHHPLVDIQGSTDTFCGICYDISATLVKFCPECNEGVCGKCVGVIHPKEDIGFIWFLATTNVAASTYCLDKLDEGKPAKCAKYNYEDVKISVGLLEQDIQVLRNEFYGTAEHQTDIKKRIDETEACIQSLKEGLKLSIEKAEAEQKTCVVDEEPKLENAGMCAVGEEPKPENASICVADEEPKPENAGMCAVGEEPKPENASICVADEEPKLENASACAADDKPKRGYASMCIVM